MKAIHSSTRSCVSRTLLIAAALFGLADTVAAHDGHALRDGARKSRAELGTSAAADARGRLWIASKEAEGTAQYVVVQSSDDRGKSWSAPRRIQREPEAVSADGENRPKIALGPNGELYVSYTKPLPTPYTGDIRFVRSLDGGQSFSEPVTVHANRDMITHRFDSLIVDREGRVFVTWIDKRDLHAAEARKQKYRGAAIYYAVSDDSGASFRGDYRVADHSCECCRVALALDADGRVAAMWRHVFEPNARDHALAVLDPGGRAGPVVRVTSDDWRVDACPHHGPGLAFAPDGTRHQVWFNVKDGEGGVFYASADLRGRLGVPVRLGSAQAAHAEVAVQGRDVVLAWKQFDGKQTVLLVRRSSDEGKTWTEEERMHTAGASDQPRVLNVPAGIVVLWRTQNEGVRVLSMQGGAR